MPHLITLFAFCKLLVIWKKSIKLNGYAWLGIFKRRIELEIIFDGYNQWNGTDDDVLSLDCEMQGFNEFYDSNYI